VQSDFGGGANHHVGNLDLNFGGGFAITQQPAGYGDSFTGNFLYQTTAGDYGKGQVCEGKAPAGVAVTLVGNNTIWNPTGEVTECGGSLAAWQAKGHDLGTTGAKWPEDSVVLGVGRKILGL
jgi:hypothetical protein